MIKADQGNPRNLGKDWRAVGEIAEEGGLAEAEGAAFRVRKEDGSAGGVSRGGSGGWTEAGEEAARAWVEWSGSCDFRRRSCAGHDRGVGTEGRRAVSKVDHGNHRGLGTECKGSARGCARELAELRRSMFRG